MSENCNHDCASCQSKCSEATSLLAPQNAGSNVKHVIGVVSGKGGVGKSREEKRISRKKEITDAGYDLNHQQRNLEKLLQKIL